MKQQGVAFLHASISLADFEAEKGFFLGMLKLSKKYTMLIYIKKVCRLRVTFITELSLADLNISKINIKASRSDVPLFFSLVSHVSC